ncbi:MAG: response regulator [Lachnospiraceae bacterium]|nr:response regulator [Lachnospiraceae bacterium]
MRTMLVDDELFSMEQFEIECKDMEEIELIGKFSNPYQALEFAKDNQIDFALLDIQMPGMNGLELGQKLKEIRPDIILIYVTAYSEYVLDAMKMKADYFILKPYDKTDIEDAFQRAKLLSKRQQKEVYIRTFGRFGVFQNNRIIHFRNSKSEELLALCVDHQGGKVSMEEAIDKLWPDKPYDVRVKGLYRKAVMMLQTELEQRGIPQIFIRIRGGCCLVKDEIDCDYFVYLENPELQRGLFRGVYLSDYSWGEETLSELCQLEQNNE